MNRAAYILFLTVAIHTQIDYLEKVKSNNSSAEFFQDVTFPTEIKGDVGALSSFLIKA